MDNATPGMLQKACPHDAIRCIQFLSDSSLWFQHNSPKELYDTNYIVPALPALCGIITNVLAWVPMGSKQLKSRYRIELYWCYDNCHRPYKIETKPRSTN